MSTIMNYAAIIHRVTDSFCFAIDDNTLEIRIKTDYDVQSVALYYNDPFIGGILGGDWTWTGTRKASDEMVELPYHKLWITRITPAYKRAKYYFEIGTKEETILYFEDGFYTEEALAQSQKKYQCFTFPWLNPIDVNRVPSWVHETIWYQIFPDRFCNGDLSIDSKKGLLWGEAKPRNEDTYNGDLRGIINKLPYLASLGINGIYMTPIFASPSTHKYDTRSYYEIDPLFGDERTLHELIDLAHSLGIRIMLDGVFNHCGWQFDKWQDVIEKGPKSAYFDWFMIEQWPFDKSMHSTKGKEFFSFAFTANMPKLNTNHPEVIAYLCDVCTYWVKEYDIDGWRLDVANEVSHAFCKELRKQLHKIKPDIFILGEIWHDAMPWLRGDEFDSVMNYPLTSAIDDFWLQENQTKNYFARAYLNCFYRYMKQTNDVLFNLMDSHDTDRLFHRVHKDIAVFYQQLLLLFTSPGTICLFYGTEIAMDGSFDPDCRACMPWTDIENGVYDDYIRRMQKLIALRKLHPACASQNICFLSTYDEDRVLLYQKKCEEETIMVIINASLVDIQVPTKQILFEQGREGDQLHPKGCMVLQVA